jgi:hypothetical protein
MTNIEDDIFLKFRKLENSVMNIDDNVINEEFNKLPNSEKLFIFAKKLILSDEDFNNKIEYDKLKKQNNKLTKESTKINNLKLKNKILSEDAYAFEVKYNKSKTYCIELEKKINMLSQECKKLEDIILEDAYVYNLKYSKLNNENEQLKIQINKIKKLINKKN